MWPQGRLRGAVFVAKRKLPAGGGQAAALADLLYRWAEHNPDPYVGPPVARLIPCPIPPDQGHGSRA